MVEEIRSSFGSSKEITLTSVSGLTYMLACLNEALRLYPPVPRGLPRGTPSEGANIAGTFVPGDVSSTHLIEMVADTDHQPVPDRRQCLDSSHAPKQTVLQTAK